MLLILRTYEIFTSVYVKTGAIITAIGFYILDKILYVFSLRKSDG